MHHVSSVIHILFFIAKYGVEVEERRPAKKKKRNVSSNGERRERRSSGESAPKNEKIRILFKLLSVLRIVLLPMYIWERAGVVYRICNAMRGVHNTSMLRMYS